MENSKSQTCPEAQIWALSRALVELRDALSGLSLALRDWQFEVDIENRKKAEETVRQLLEKVGAAHGNIPR